MHRTTLITALVAACLVVVSGVITKAGGATITTIPGCAPQCLTPGLTRPGNLPAGTYTTHYFFGGEMTLSFPKGWAAGEDSTGEFLAWSRGDVDSRVIFWEDVYPVTAPVPGTWKRVGSLRWTSAKLLSWLQKNPNLTVSRPASGMIGTIRARVVDIGVTQDAVNDDPQCPEKACANFVQFPQWNTPYGIAGTKAVSRFYFGDVRYGGQRHMFVAVVEALSRAKLDAFLPSARKVIATVRVPATSA